MAWFSNLANQAIQFADRLADNIVAEANKAQNEIVAEQNKIKNEEEKKKHDLNSESISLPWETQDESRSIISQDLMERILSLSQSENNFTLPPNHFDKAVEFDFNLFVPIAMRLLTLDSNLARVHAKLMPKMNEEDFWRHYYFRIQYLRAKLNIDDRKVYEGRFIFSEEEENAIIYPPGAVNSINQISHHQPLQQQQHTTNVDMSSLATNHSNAITTPTHLKDGESNNNPNDSNNNDKVKDKERQQQQQQQRERRQQQDAELAAEVLAELAGDNSYNNGNTNNTTTATSGTAIHSSSSLSSLAGALAGINNSTNNINDHVYTEYVHDDDDELELSDLDELLKDIIDNEDNDEEGEGIINNNKASSSGDDDLDLLEDIMNSTTIKSSNNNNPSA